MVAFFAGLIKGGGGGGWKKGGRWLVTTVCRVSSDNLYMKLQIAKQNHRLRGHKKFTEYTFTIKDYHYFQPNIPFNKSVSYLPARTP